MKYQLRLGIGAWNVASSLESAGDATAHDFWSRAHQILVGLDASGRLAGGDRHLLDQVTRKLGRS